MKRKTFPIDLSDYHIVVSGSGGLIGSYLTEEFHKLGAKLTLIDKEFKENHWSENINAENIFKIEADVLNRNSLNKSIQLSVEKNGLIDSVLCLAAIDHKVNSTNSLNKSTLENYSATGSLNEYELSIHGSINLINSCISNSNPTRLSIVLVGSDLSIIAPYQRLYKESLGEGSEKPFTYSTVKHALLGLTKYLATYWENDSIRVNLLCPSGIETSEMPNKFKEKLSALNPLNRLCQINELLGPSIFLLTDMSTFYNGQSLILDGGRSIW